MYQSQKALGPQAQGPKLAGELCYPQNWYLRFSRFCCFQTVGRKREKRVQDKSLYWSDLESAPITSSYAHEWGFSHIMDWQLGQGLSYHQQPVPRGAKNARWGDWGDWFAGWHYHQVLFCCCCLFLNEPQVYRIGLIVILGSQYMLSLLVHTRFLFVCFLFIIN